MPKVLCISFDEAVSHARLEMLARLGCEVLATIHPEEAIRLLSAQKFDLVVVGHRFPKTERHHIAETARRKHAHVVLICGAATDADIPADARVFALEGPEGLEAAARRFLPVPSVA